MPGLAVLRFRLHVLDLEVIGLRQAPARFFADTKPCNSSSNRRPTPIAQPEWHTEAKAMTPNR